MGGEAHALRCCGTQCTAASRCRASNRGPAPELPLRGRHAAVVPHDLQLILLHVAGRQRGRRLGWGGGWRRRRLPPRPAPLRGSLGPQLRHSLHAIHVLRQGDGVGVASAGGADEAGSSSGGSRSSNGTGPLHVRCRQCSSAAQAAARARQPGQRRSRSCCCRRGCGRGARRRRGRRARRPRPRQGWRCGPACRCRRAQRRLGLLGGSCRPLLHCRRRQWYRQAHEASGAGRPVRAPWACSARSRHSRRCRFSHTKPAINNTHTSCRREQQQQTGA